MNKILIIEDDAAYGLTISNWAKKNGYEPTHCMTMELAKKEILRQNFRIALTDLRLPDGDGIMLLAWIKDKRPDVQVIVMTSYAEIQSAVSAIKLGAFDYLEKPVNPRILKEKIEQAMQNAPLPSPRVSVSQKKQRDGDEDRDGNRVGNIVYGESPASKQLYDYIRIVAPTNMSVLIVGESGTGKEHAAHMIHEYSPRSAAPFIAVDCGSLSRELAPSELFGHLKGAFTSAVANKKGVFEVANGGTVFLDEVGNLPYDVQIQLLRALQERKIRPVGAANDITIDVRIIVATNENLEAAIAAGRFREDLYHRLDEFMLRMPPLRERHGDLPRYVEHFLENANQELNKNIKGFSRDAMAAMKPAGTAECRPPCRTLRQRRRSDVTEPPLLHAGIDSPERHSGPCLKERLSPSQRTVFGRFFGTPDRPQEAGYSRSIRFSTSFASSSRRCISSLQPG